MDREVRKTVGVYERPARPKWPRMLALVLAVVALIVWVAVAYSAEPSWRSTEASSERSVTLSLWMLPTERRLM